MKSGLVLLAVMLVVRVAEAVPCGKYDFEKLEASFQEYQDLKKNNQIQKAAAMKSLNQARAQECGLKSIDELSDPSRRAKAHQNALRREFDDTLARINTSSDPKNIFLFDMISEYATEGEFDSEVAPKIAAARKAFDIRTRMAARQSSADIENNCAAINHNAKLPPIRDQGSIGWCYAYVAADLLSFKLKQNISAFDLALGYNSEDHKENLRAGSSGATDEFVFNKEGGTTSAAIHFSREKGYCNEADMPSNSSVDQDIGALIKSAAEADLNNENIRCDLADQLAGVMPKIKKSQILMALKTAHKNQLAEKFREFSCLNRLKPPPFEVDTEYNTHNENEFVRKIQVHLQKNNIVGIGVGLESLLKDRPPDFPHALIVVGQEKNSKTGRCEFVLRNSWGKSCERFDTTKVRCDANGLLRVNSETLAQITYEMTVIK